jgi:hypothetical protein
MELFDSGLLSKVSCPAPFVVRSVRTDDFEKDFLGVLAQLTQVGNVSRDRFGCISVLSFSVSSFCKTQVL